MLSPESSQRLKLLRFPLIVGVVLIHASDTVVSVGDRSVGVPELNHLANFVRVFVAEGVARSAVPLFFLMSGYFFAQGFDGTLRAYLEKLKSRTTTLLIPFLFWNLLTLAVYALAQSIPLTARLMSGKNQLADFGVTEYVVALFGVGRMPIVYQFWFIRDLMLLVLVSPALFWLLRRPPLAKLVVASLSLAWLVGTWPVIIPSVDATFFFTLGLYVGVSRSDIFFFDAFRMPISAAYLLLLAADAWSGGWDANFVPHKITIALGVAVCLSLTSSVLSRPRLRDALLQLSYASFFVYAAHEPLLMILRKIAYLLFTPTTSASALMLFFLVPLIVIALLVFVYRLLTSVTPAFAGWVTGGRRAA